jgi:hypothetical protein
MQGRTEQLSDQGSTTPRSAAMQPPSMGPAAAAAVRAAVLLQLSVSVFTAQPRSRTKFQGLCYASCALNCKPDWIPQRLKSDDGGLPSAERNGQWTQAKFYAANHGTGGPLLGNADLSVVVQTSPSAEELTMFVTKTDAWDTHDIMGLGQVTIGIPALGGGTAGPGDSYNLTQDIALAEVRGSFSRAANKTTAAFSSFIADSANVQVTEVSITSPQPQVITVSNMVYNLTVGRHGLIGGSVGTGGGGQAQQHMWGLRVDDSNVGTGLRAGLPLRMSLATSVHTDPASSTTTSSCNNGGALCDGSPPRPGHPPDHSRCQCTQTIQLTAGTHTVTVVTAAVSMFNVLQAGGENGSEVASAVALLPEVTAVPALRAEHREWWASYWNASHLSLPAQPLLEDFYFRSLYLLGSAARSTSLVPPGLCGAWFAGSGPSRYGVSG